MLSRRDSRIVLGAIAAGVAIGAGLVGREYVHEQAQLTAHAEAVTGGDAARGRALIAAYGCGGCHHIEGVPQAEGLVGPPLDTIGARAFIAGKLRNTPENLRRWIENPQAVSPGTAMPNLGIRPNQARDITAFLYTRS